MKRNLLITGGAGFIGSNFLRYWSQHHSEDTLVVLDNLTYSGSLENLPDPSKFIFIKGDIADSNCVSHLFQQHHINTVVNFAAESHVDRSIYDPSLFIRTNINGTYVLLDVAKQFWLNKSAHSEHRFHQISTDEVFGTLSSDQMPFTERSLYQPNSPYAASKASADHLVRAFHKTYGLNVTISHCSNNYGPYHYPEKFIPLCLTKILQGGEIPVYGDGNQIRDWLHVHDHCRAIESILVEGRPGQSYNIGGNGAEFSNLSVVYKLCETVAELFRDNPHYKTLYPDAAPFTIEKFLSQIVHVTDRLGHDRRYAINSKKIQQDLDFKYQIAWDDGIRQTVQWYLDHSFWWETKLLNGVECVDL